MIFAIVKNGIVENVIEATADFLPGLVVANSSAEPGGSYAAGVFTRKQAHVKSASEVSELARQKLFEIDAQSIRAIREYIVSKADAPVILITRNLEAAIERAKITP